MIGWEQWRTLLVVSQYGSFAQAAAALNVDATTVGRRLKGLEADVGFTLFFRDEGKLVPSRKCEDLLRLLETADDALRSAARMSCDAEEVSTWRELRMTAPPFLIQHVFAPNVTKLTARRNIRIEMIATSSNSALTRREADLSIRIEDRPSGFRVDYDRIRAVRIGTLEYAVCAPLGADAASLPWAGLPDSGLSTTGTVVMNKLAGTNRFRYQVPHFGALIEILAAGGAQALLPRQIARRDRRLEIISDVVLEQPLWMLYHKQDEDIVHLRASRDWIAALVDSYL